MGAMTKKEIEAVLDRVRTWPLERQEDAARTLIRMEADSAGIYRLSDEERVAVEKSRESARRGEFASDEEVTALFDRYRR